MADVAASIRAYLLTKTAVTDLVSTRIYTDIVPQGATLPAIAYSKISTTPDHTLGNLAGVSHCRMQFDCYATTRAAANDIAEAIRATGICAIRGTYTDVFICGVQLESGQRNEVDYAQDGSDDHRYVTSFDLMVHYTETI
jgi:predicted aminopeptidase